MFLAKRNILAEAEAVSVAIENIEFAHVVFRSHIRG